MANSFVPAVVVVVLLLVLASSSIPSVTPSVVAPLNLRTAASYVIFAQTGISTTGTTAVTGNLAVSPASSSKMTGWGLTLSSDGIYSKSTFVTGNVYAASYEGPTPSTLRNAVNDMHVAYLDAVGRTNPDRLNYGLCCVVSSNTFYQGLYEWTTGLTLGGPITLNGTTSSVFIFQVAGTLSFHSDANVVLNGGAVAGNVFWVSAGEVTLEAGAHVQGTILGKAGIAFESGASLYHGRALAQTTVTLDSNILKTP